MTRVFAIVVILQMGFAAPGSADEAAPPALGESGWEVRRDPATGALLDSPPPTAPTQPKRGSPRPSRAVKEVPGTSPKGGATVYLDESFEMRSVVRKPAGGEPQVDCWRATEPEGHRR